MRVLLAPVLAATFFAGCFLPPEPPPENDPVTFSTLPASFTSTVGGEDADDTYNLEFGGGDPQPFAVSCSGQGVTYDVYGYRRDLSGGQVEFVQLWDDRPCDTGTTFLTADTTRSLYRFVVSNGSEPTAYTINFTPN